MISFHYINSKPAAIYNGYNTIGTKILSIFASIHNLLTQLFTFPFINTDTGFLDAENIIET